jgi:uncharacterized protein YlxP (DUF503 family)
MSRALAPTNPSFAVFAFRSGLLAQLVQPPQLAPQPHEEAPPEKIPTPHTTPALHCMGTPQHPMPVAQLTLEIRIDHAQSLKDRRHVVRSLKDQLRQGFNVSVAEMDEATLWNSATLGIVAISRSRDYLHGLMEKLERASRRMTTELSADLAEAFWDYIEV